MKCTQKKGRVNFLGPPTCKAWSAPNCNLELYILNNKVAYVCIFLSSLLCVIASYVPFVHITFGGIYNVRVFMVCDVSTFY